MRSVLINIKTNRLIKARAQKIAQELGFSLSSLINAYLNQLIRTKTILFSTVEEIPSEYMIQALKEADEDRKKWRYRSFKSADDALAKKNYPVRLRRPPLLKKGN